MPRRFVVEMSQNFICRLGATYLCGAPLLKLRETRAQIITGGSFSWPLFSALAKTYALGNLYPGLTFSLGTLPEL